MGHAARNHQLHVTGLREVMLKEEDDREVARSAASLPSKKQYVSKKECESLRAPRTSTAPETSRPMPASTGATRATMQRVTAAAGIPE